MTIERIEAKAAFAVDDEGAITGNAWDFSSPDRVGDEITPAAFADAVGKSLPMLFSHDQAQTVGVWDSVTVEPDGLKVSGRLLVKEVVRAAEVRALIQSKAITGLSVGFITQKAAPRKGGGRTISKAELVECSLVAIPAHPNARISTIKEADLANENTKVEVTTEDPKPQATTEVKAADLQAANDNIVAITKRLEAAETALARPKAAPANDNEPSAEMKSFGKYLRLGDGTPEEDKKSMTVSNDESAGYLAPAEMSNEFIRELVEFSPIRSIASVRNIAGSSVKYPRRTGVTNAEWEGEGEDSTESTVTFGQAEVTPKKLMTYVDISNELLADSGGTAQAEVNLALAEDFGQKEGVSFVNGTGANQPEGILTNADVAPYLNGHATNLNADKLITMMYDLPAMYRGNGVWLMNGTTQGVIRTIKDGNGNFIWQPGLQAGQPPTLLGRPVVEAVDMPDVASGEFPIVFGDFNRAYRIVDRLSMSILVNPYLLATKGLTRIHATRRVGGRVIQASALRKLKMATS